MRFNWRSTHWLLADVVEGVRCGVNNLALDLVGPSTVVSQAASAAGHVDILGHAESFAIVQSLNRGEEVGILLKELGKLDKKLSTVLWGFFPPWSVEGFAGSSDGDIDILL